MDLKKRIKIAFVLNLLIFVVMFFGAICSIFDFNFMTTGTHRFSPDFSRFKYFGWNYQFDYGDKSRCVFTWKKK